MRIDIYVGQTKYFSTLSASEAFDMFRRWISSGMNVKMQFIRL